MSSFRGISARNLDFGTDTEIQKPQDEKNRNFYLFTFFTL